MKWKWRIVNDRGVIWRDLIKHRYNKSEVKMFISDVCAINCGNSIWWRDLILIDSIEDGKHNCFSDNTFCRVNDGINTYFLFNNWAGCQPLKDAFSELFLLDVDPACSVAEAW